MLKVENVIVGKRHISEEMIGTHIVVMNTKRKAWKSFLNRLDSSVNIMGVDLE
jgi:hypothetical protein